MKDLQQPKKMMKINLDNFKSLLLLLISRLLIPKISRIQKIQNMRERKEKNKNKNNWKDKK